MVLHAVKMAFWQGCDIRCQEHLHVFIGTVIFWGVVGSNPAQGISFFRHLLFIYIDKAYQN